MSRLSRQCGILNISQSYRPPRTVKGKLSLLFFFRFQIKILKNPEAIYADFLSVFPRGISGLWYISWSVRFRFWSLNYWYLGHLQRCSLAGYLDVQHPYHDRNLKKREKYRVTLGICGESLISCAELRNKYNFISGNYGSTAWLSRKCEWAMTYLTTRQRSYVNKHQWGNSVISHLSSFLFFYATMF
jgi:hypothetical protein